MATRKVFVRGATPAKASKPSNNKPSNNAIRPGPKKRPRPGKTKGGDPYASSIPTVAEVEANPELLSGTGRGNPACPTLRVNARRRPSHVVVSEGENGAVRATVRGIDVTGILRWLGKAGFSWHVAATWLTSIGVPLRRNTIVSQVSAGAGYDPKRWQAIRGTDTLRGDIPDVDSATQAEIRRIAKLDPSYEFESV